MLLESHPILNRAQPNPEASLRFTVLLGVMIALPALGTDILVPAVPALAESLSASVNAGQFTLTAFFIGLAAGQVLWGPLSDRYGRKPVLLAGLAITLASSLASAGAESIETVSLARLAQGLGMASGSLIGRTIVRDLYAREHAARLLSRMTIVFSLVPICAPLAGAMLSESAGWRAVFVATAAVAAVLMAAIFHMRETAPTERRSVHPAAIARTFAFILRDRRFLAPLILVLCTQVGVIAWVSNSSFTLVRGLGISVMAYSVLFATVMLGQISGAWASSRFVLRHGIARMLSLGSAIMLGAGATAAALAWAGIGHWLAVVLPFMAFLFGTALVTANAIAAALSPFPESAGSATSLIGAIGFAGGALVSTGLGSLYDGTARPLATVAVLSGLGAFFVQRAMAREAATGPR